MSIQDSLYDILNLRRPNRFNSGIWENDPLKQQQQSTLPTFPDVGMQGNVPPEVQSTRLPQIADQSQQSYVPETVERDRLRALLDNPPERNRPSFGRSLVAAGLSIGSKDPIGTAERVLYASYHRAMEDWKSKVDPGLRSDELENRSNINERQLETSRAQAQNQAAAIVSREKIAADRDAIARIKSDTDRAKAEGASVDIDKGSGQVVVSYKVGPRAGQVEYHKIPGSATEEELANIRGQWNVNVAKQQGANSATVAGINADSREKVADDKGWGQPVMIADPDDPTKQIAVQTHLGTGVTRRVKLDGQQVGTITKPGTTPKVAPAQQNVMNMANETLAQLNEIIDEKDQLRPHIASVIGAGRYNPLVALNVPNTPYVTANDSIKRLKDQLTLELLGELKKQSRTGASGMGNISDKDMAILASAASKIDPAMPREDFLKEILRVREYVKKLVTPTDGFTPVTTEKIMTPADYRKKYGG